jgi:Tfp pilus assembly protein PilE
MNKKGLTLVELLGAVVIFGISISLIALLLSVIFNANDKILEQSRANTEGTIVIAHLEDLMRSFAVTDYSTCVGNTNCVILESHYSYELSGDSTSIVLVTHTPPMTLQISIENNELYINGIIREIRNFQIHSDSYIEKTTINNQLKLKIVLILYANEGKTYTFTSNQTFDLSEVPTS